MNGIVIIHHGVKGMKCGVRRYRNKDGSLTEEGKRREQVRSDRAANKEKRAEYKRASKNRRLLSDEELVARIGRLEMEKRLRDLTDDNVRSEGEKIVREILIDSGKRTLKTVIPGAAMYGAKVGLTGRVNLDEAANYITPNPNRKK